ncbi:hypothetical protein DS909_14425 [Phaeobacter gallaeciensis]|uniref:Uncharacterized protein n=1 Tax=Phaeobacter gallaeciensis TaxID=60890 RepID=A0A366WVI3_9RHOB|nr:hypothetical protein DS909_14425 [Phaeobacter gallaeciensis]
MGAILALRAVQFPLLKIDGFEAEGMRLLNFNIEIQYTPSCSLMNAAIRRSLGKGTLGFGLGGVLVT